MGNTFPFSDPVGVSRSTTAQIGLEAIDHRRGQGALSAPMHGNTFGTLSGVFPGGTSGAGPSNDLACSGTSGRTASFNAGHYAADRGTGNLYLGMAYAGWSIDLDVGDAVNPRIDLVVIRNRDPGLSGDGPVTASFESAKPVVLKGTPSASPAKPNGQLTNGDVPLWYFTVGGGSQQNNIIASEDARLFVEGRGGIRLRTARDTRSGAYEGQCAYNLETSAFEIWDGAVWQPVASAAGWIPFTPKLFSDNGECSLGTAGSAFGRYQVIGKLLHVRYAFRAVRPCNMGKGPVYTLLPAGLVSEPNRENNILAKLQAADGGGAAYWQGYAEIAPNQSKVQPWFPFAVANTTMGRYIVAGQQGAEGNSNPDAAGTIPDPYQLNIQGTIEIK